MSKIDRKGPRRLINWILPGFFAVFIIFLINTFFLQLVHVPSHDMKQSYHRGDLILLNKFFPNYKKYDVIAFNYYEDDITDTMPIVLIQRCIALPGDTLELDNGFIYVNNAEDKYISELQFN